MNARKDFNDRIVSLPGLKKLDGVQFAGYASINGAFYPKEKSGKEGKLFYWFVGGEDYAERSTVIWTNGGPGSSSFWGFFLENGPYRIASADKPKLTPRIEGWNHYANYMIFEHPLGVMLSFERDKDDLPATVEEGIQQYYQALVNFLADHPEIADNPIILAGESYAGTYLPLLAKMIVDGNTKSEGGRIELKGTVLCDGWVDPYAQMAEDTHYAYTHGMISAREKRVLDEKYRHNLPGVNEAIHRISGLHMANIAELADPDFQPVIDYLNRKDVRKAIHADPSPKLTSSWSHRISDNYAFGVNDSYVSVVQELLDRGERIVVVSGLNDAKDCNFLGTAKWLDTLGGDAAERFHEATTEQWRTGSDTPVLGYIQDGGLLTWAKILNAGHMAAMDQPKLIELLKARIGF